MVCHQAYSKHSSARLALRNCNLVLGRSWHLRYFEVNLLAGTSPVNWSPSHLWKWVYHLFKCDKPVMARSDGNDIIGLQSSFWGEIICFHLVLFSPTNFRAGFTWQLYSYLLWFSRSVIAKVAKNYYCSHFNCLYDNFTFVLKSPNVTISYWQFISPSKKKEDSRLIFVHANWCTLLFWLTGLHIVPGLNGDHN